MDKNYESIFDDAKVEAGKFDVDDWLSFGSNYFACGYNPNEQYYNHSIAIAFAIIGKLYYDQAKGSNYRKGVAYIAKELCISKRQVKALRKQMRSCDGYVFKTPYLIPKIIDKMIELLKDKENDSIISEFLEQRKDELYREILIEKQYSAVMTAAKRGGREKVKVVAGKLGALTQKVGG